MKVSEQAVIELRKALDGFDKPGAGIHVFNAAGCCGPSIQMDIAEKPGNGETVVSLESIDFFVAEDLISTLEPVTIEYGSNGFKLVGLKRSSSGCCG